MLRIVRHQAKGKGSILRIVRKIQRLILGAISISQIPRKKTKGRWNKLKQAYASRTSASAVNLILQQENGDEQRANL